MVLTLYSIEPRFGASRRSLKSKVLCSWTSAGRRQCRLQSGIWYIR